MDTDVKPRHKVRPRASWPLRYFAPWCLAVFDYQGFPATITLPLSAALAPLSGSRPIFTCLAQTYSPGGVSGEWLSVSCKGSAATHHSLTHHSLRRHSCLVFHRGGEWLLVSGKGCATTHHSLTHNSLLRKVVLYSHVAAILARRTVPV